MSATARFVALYGAYVAALHLVDGPWRNWKRGRPSADPWTVTHVAWGVVARRMGLGRAEFLTLGALNELTEWGVRAFRPDLLWGSPESPANVALDMAANWAGWELGRP